MKTTINEKQEKPFPKFEDDFEPCHECGAYMIGGEDEEDFCDECGWPHFHGTVTLEND